MLSHGSDERGGGHILEMVSLVSRTPRIGHTDGLSRLTTWLVTKSFTSKVSSSTNLELYNQPNQQWNFPLPVQNGCDWQFGILQRLRQSPRRVFRRGECNSDLRGLRSPVERSVFTSFESACQHQITNTMIGTSDKSVSTKSKPSAFPSALRSKRSAIQTLTKADTETSAVIQQTCPECGREEMRFSVAQLRGADEGTTVFYFCECGHRCLSFSRPCGLDTYNLQVQHQQLVSQERRISGCIYARNLVVKL
jgi:DNA-directed RNA polymerase subunit M/transcription elongation factor TFIIS